MSSQQLPSPLFSVVDQNGRLQEIFRRYLQSLDGDVIVDLASLPPPIQGYRCFITDAAGGGGLGIPAYADGVNWRRYSDNSVIA